MRKSKIKCVVVHTEGIDRAALAARVSVYHAEVIERHLKETGLTNAQKVEVLDRIVEQMKMNEDDRGLAL